MMMRVAVSADGKDLDALIDPRFGRCAFFIVVETEDMNFEVFDNENIALGGGAGIQSAQFIAAKGVEAIITGNCGPNAVKALNAAGIKIILSQSGTVRDAVEEYRKGLLDTASEANVADHYGISGGSSNPGTFSGNMGRCRGGGRGTGRGMGRGIGGGRGMSRGNDGELSCLKNQTEQLRSQIDVIESRIKNLEKP
jgi:predicted Fe-Mo cluster-binding NifX family protein